MIFKNRWDAGEKLAEKLLKYAGQPDVIIIGLPRGGVVTAHAVSKKLNQPLDVICPRKIGAPQNPELAIGAITETGEGVFNERILALLNVSDEYITRTIEQEKKVAERRLKIFRKDRPLLNVEGKTVIIVDDGLATGATMKAAIKSMQSRDASSIIVAVPVAPFETVEELRGEVDEIVVLAIPSNFQAVGQFYDEFAQTEDEEVISILTRTR